MSLILGTAQFGLKYGVANQAGQLSSVEAQDILDFAAKSGVRALDTAAAYGNAEQVLGLLNTHELPLISKLPVQLPHASECESWVIDQVEGSLHRLKRSNLQTILFHRPEQLLSPAGPSLIRGLNRLRDSGLVRQIGLSVYHYSQVEAVLQFLRPDVVQLPFNVFDQRAAQLGWFKTLSALGVEIHVRSAFLQGLLLMHPDSIPSYFAPWRSKLTQWHEFFSSMSVSPQALCLQFLKQHPEISGVVVGVDSSRQLQEIVHYYRHNIELPDLDFLSVSDESLVNPANWNV